MCAVGLVCQDDGYAGTLEKKRTPNTAGELGREGNPLIPLRVREGSSCERGGTSHSL